MRVRIQHVSEYTYDVPVHLGPHTIRLTPAPHLASRMLTYNLDIEPAEAKVHWQLDPWANKIARVTFDPDLDVHRLRIQVDASFDLVPVNPFDFFVDPRCRELPFEYPDGLDEELAPFLDQSAVDPAASAWADGLPFEGSVVDYLVALNNKANADLGYTIRMEPGIQTPAETLDIGRGSCRDFAVLLVDALRSRGLAARFVSGYLIQLEDEGNIPGLPRGMDHDVLDLHAWAEVYLPGAGWIGLDGTSGLLTTEGHIPLAATVTPSLAAPISGTATGPASNVEFHMEVERVGHQPRPRKPYADDSWERLLQMGDTVDASLQERGVSLTVGGEPTWTSRSNAGDDEWVTEAVGGTKLAQGLRMAHELRQRVDPGAVGLHRFGKHYPGESLPRWALHLIWRKDGVPIWRNPDLLDFGVESQEQRTLDHARELMVSICDGLGIDNVLHEAYEDPWYALAVEGNLPMDVDPTEADPDDPESRQRLARMLNHGLSNPTGYVTPIQWQGTRWETQRWLFRREKLFLIPGDSPVGLRLPLDRLGGSAYPDWVQDPMAIDKPLAFDPRTVVQSQHEPAELLPPAGPGTQPHIRTALCVQPRNNIMHVFLPPVPTTEAFLDLVASVENAAAQNGIRVRLEGYAPPSDHRLDSMMVTPDPGVIEVNMPVSHSARQYADYMEMLAAAATHADLCTERFQLDGRSVGSGGGNHITLGGPSPAESPFLKYPGVLASLVRFVQNHPSLSYLFGGLFIGPTSQAPRPDEARLDTLAELQLALDRIEHPSDPPFPWYADRILRNLLVDVTGNTHRTEICIDKLFNPSSPTGRLGIVELRAFEMPPNERMSVASVVLFRALIASFFIQPYRQPLTQFGRGLHDRFMLPYFLWDDLLDVLDYVRSCGFPLDAEWYSPYVEYRFPRLGRITAEGVELDLRPALEPWPVLGEEPTGATVSRYVDSSLERLELRVRGLDADRYAIAINGWAPELPTAPRDSELRVLGIRFRAWQPPHCLHPHIGIHHPVQFDIVDREAKRSVGSCAAHVWHPDGRAFTEPPLTADEATARRASRFTINQHMAFPAHVRPARLQPETPYTLDLRWLQGDRQLPYVDPDDNEVDDRAEEPREHDVSW